MSELVLPPWIVPEQESQQWLDEGTSSFQSTFAPGLSQQQSYGGVRLKLSRRHHVRLEEKDVLLSILRLLKGRFNTLRTKVHYLQRGSFSSSELFVNSDFVSGTTGWSTDTGYQLTTLSRIGKIQRTSIGAASTAVFQTPSGLTVNNIYQLRANVLQGRGDFTNFGLVVAGNTNLGLTIGTLGTLTFNALATSFVTGFLDQATSGNLAGDYLNLPYVSLRRGALVDNGGNLFVFSDQFDNAAWLKNNVSISVNAAVSPDGTTTADEVDENGATGEHSLSQSFAVPSASTVLAGSMCFKAAGRGWVTLRFYDSVSGDAAFAYFNISAGAVGTVANSASMLDGRGYITSLGNNWYRATFVARKANSATSLLFIVNTTTGNGASLTPAGITANAMYVWRGGAAISLMPWKPSQSTASLVTPASQTGNRLNIKGLFPVSTNGLLLAGDFVEIENELKQLTAPLDSDSAGLGTLQFEPEMFRSPADNANVVIKDPMGKFIVSNVKVENEFGLYADVSYDLEHIYD